MARIITTREKFEFFLQALKEHTFLYGISLLPLSLAGIGGGILYFANDLNTSQMVGATLSLVLGTGFFLMIIYFSISSMRYHYGNAIIKKYGRYMNVPVAEITLETNEADEAIRCSILVKHSGKTVGDLFELPLEKEHLVPVLEGMQEVPVRVVKEMPSLLRIAPRKLLWELEVRENKARRPEPESHRKAIFSSLSRSFETGFK